MRDLGRRLTALEARKALVSRRVVVIYATDDADKDRQIAEKQLARTPTESDVLICLSGMPVGMSQTCQLADEQVAEALTRQPLKL